MSKNGSRPTSPHLMIYQPQLTSILSIFHRFAGIVLLEGVWLLALSVSLSLLAPSWWDAIYYATPTWLSSLLFLIFVATAIYHLLNGVRHLLWDKLIGLEIEQVYFSGKVVIALFMVIFVGFCFYLGL